MAFLPSVPTSFMPQQSFVPKTGRRIDFGGAFAFICYGILLLVCLSAAGVFAYSKILSAELAAKEAELAKAQANLDEPTVRGLVELRNRLTSGSDLLKKHVAFSGLLDLLEKVTIANVRISSLDVNLDENHTAKVTFSGDAKNFNALAAESRAMGGDARFKDAIFSAIRLGVGGTVNFAVTAKVDPVVIVFAADGSATAEPVVTSPATSSPKTP